jgi:protein TonB
MSVFLHIFLWLAVGYMAVRQTVPPPDTEQVIELDVVALPDAGSAEPEPEIAPAPAPEILPPEEPLPVEPPPVIVNDDIVDSKLVPEEIPAEKAMPSPVNSSKRSAKGTPPIVLVRVDPVNPPELAEVGRKVVVVLRMQILTNGSPGKISIAVPSGYKSINDAAIAAAKKWHFEPAKDHEGRPVVCLTILSIPFIPQ